MIALLLKDKFIIYMHQRQGVRETYKKGIRELLYPLRV